MKTQQISKIDSHMVCIAQVFKMVKNLILYQV